MLSPRNSKQRLQDKPTIDNKNLLKVNTNSKKENIKPQHSKGKGLNATTDISFGFTKRNVYSPRQCNRSRSPFDHPKIAIIPPSSKSKIPIPNFNQQIESAENSHDELSNDEEKRHRRKRSERMKKHQ